MMYIRPQEYYDNLAKRLGESELAKTSKVADICLASNIEADDDSSHVSGLINTGNTCFMNSVLQALSSLPHLHNYLEHISHIATGVPLPVTRSLLKTIRSLAKPLHRRSSFRPVDIVTALSSNRRIISREQQDAQEFFQLVSSAMDTEGQQIAKTEQLGGGLRGLLNQTTLKGIIRPEWVQKTSFQSANTQNKMAMMTVNDHLENPFTGLLANRLSCMQCGYTGAIRHFSFNNIQLNVPNKYTTTLEECLSHFTSMEYLQDASCRKCSFETTVKALTTEIESLKHQSKKLRNDTKKKREVVAQVVTMEKAKRELEHRLSVGRIEEESDHDKLPLLRSVSRMSSKQVMLAKPPKILCLHISRSAFLNTGAIYKNTCQLLFPEYLDVSPFSTNGTLHTQPNIPISTMNEKSAGKGFYYRLMSVVVHYGSHSFGHFVAFKRRIYADQCKCYQCTGNVSVSATEKAELWKCQNSWYRISDSKVDECSIEDVKRSNPYMLLYELISDDDVDLDADECEDDGWMEGDNDEGTEDTSLEADAPEQDNTTTNTNSDYTNIPTDDAAQEALRIAKALMMEDHK
ncbi:cysteine proteinase [Mucor ambiguus]|uniref:Ubiquitin carboxyl-terminal hydrolase n=1 Tax=Mucor ambiguus TaxID=91626 RepID=A0A0C9MXD8_9FUNG|nr:cysteine proteinase [Mucor ambiguus]